MLDSIKQKLEQINLIDSTEFKKAGVLIILMREEIDLDINNIQRLGALNYLLSKHKIEVHPYIGYLNKHQNFSGNYEIDEIFTVPLSFLMHPKNITYKEFKKNELKLYIPSWVYNGNKIWGLTAMIAADFLNICFDASIKTDFDSIRKYDEY